MEWNELREKYKQLLLKWNELRTNIEPLDKIVIGVTLEPGKELKAIPNDVWNSWWRLKEEEVSIFGEIARLHEEYYNQKNK